MRSAWRRATTLGVVALVASGLVGCQARDAEPQGTDASDRTGPFDPLGVPAWPTSMPRPDMPLVDEHEAGVAFLATYELDGASLDDFAAQLVDAGFAAEAERTFSDGSHLVLLDAELGRLHVSILPA